MRRATQVEVAIAGDAEMQQMHWQMEVGARMMRGGHGVEHHRGNQKGQGLEAPEPKVNKLKAPTVGLEPTTTRLRALRSAG